MGNNNNDNNAPPPPPRWVWWHGLLGLGIVAAVIIIISVSVSLAASSTPARSAPLPPDGTIAWQRRHECVAAGDAWDADHSLCLPIVNAPIALERSIIDDNVAACQGFFEHACGRWIAQHQNADRAFSSIHARNQADTNALIHQDSPDEGIASFFRSCMSTLVDTDGGNSAERRRAHAKRRAVADRESELERAYMIERALRPLVHLERHLVHSLSILHLEGYTTPVRVEIERHPTQPHLIPLVQVERFPEYFRSPAVIRTHFEQLGDRYAPYAIDQRVKQLTSLFNALAALDESPDSTSLDFISYIKNGQLERDTSYTAAQCGLDPYMRALGLGDEHVGAIWVPGNEDACTHMRAIMEGRIGTLEQWRAYVEYSVLVHSYNFMPELPSDVYFKQHDMRALSERHSTMRWNKRTDFDVEGGYTRDDCVRATKYMLPGLVARRYLATSFPHEEETRARVTAMVERLRDQYAQLVERTTWMDDGTRAAALHKIRSIIVRVLHPNQWEVEPFADQMDPDRYLRNVNIVRRYRVQRNLRQWNATRTLDRDRISLFGAPLSTVNAWYSPTTNTITVFAGILRPPFYDHRYDEGSMYGGIGMVVAHELSHALDNTGRLFDAEGSFVDWWSRDSRDAYQARAQCIVREYETPFSSGPSLIPTTCPNEHYGQQTLGEDIADSVGLRLAYDALASDDRHTNQYFFYTFGQNWCSHYDEERLCDRVQNDPHALARYRVDKAVRQMPEFSQWFGCAPGTPMHNALGPCNFLGH